MKNLRTLPALILALGLFTINNAHAQSAGYALITDADSPNFVEPAGTYVLTEYYCGSYGQTTYSINGQTFVNNPGRVGGTSYVQGSVSFSGNAGDAANLATISEGSQYNKTFDFTVPTTAGHNYVLELLFHDNAWSSSGQRVFTVNAGPAGSPTNVLYANMDLAALGAGLNDNADVVLYYVQNNASANGIEVTMSASVNNALISGLLLLDMTAATNPPVIYIAPTNQTAFATFSTSLSCVGVGASGFTYQWQTDAGSPGTFRNLDDGVGGVSGATSSTLTLADLTTAEQGNYQAILTDAAGSVTSSPPAVLTVQAVSALTGISSPTNLNTSGNFVIAEYYGANYGSLPIDGLTFYNNNARLGSDNVIFTDNTPNFGATSSDTNLSLISGTDLYNTNGGFDIVLPTVANRSYSLQLIFHENFFSTVGSRVFNVSAGLNDQGLGNWAQNVDLVQLGAYGTEPEDAVLTTNFISDGSTFEIKIQQVTQNPILCALTLQDLSPAPVPPLVNIEPMAATNLFVGRNFSLATEVGGTPLLYQWQVYPLSGGSTNNVANTGNIFGATSNIMTITNATLAEAANYQLDVGNTAANEATSSVETVTIYPSNAIAAGANYPYAVLSSNAVDYWALNEPAGTPIVYDNGPGAKDGTVGLDATLGQPGPESPQFPGFSATNSSLLTLAGAEGITTPPLGFTANTVSMLVWLNPAPGDALQSAQDSGSGIMLSRNGTSGSYTAGLTYGVTLQSFGDYSLRYFWNGVSADSGLQIPNNIWSLVGLVVTPTNTTLYVINANGSQSVTFQGTNAPCPFVNPFNIANDPDDGGNGSRTFTGSVDEPAVFTNALNYNQILNLYDVAVGITTASPMITPPASPVIAFPGTTVNLSCQVSGTPTPTLQWMTRPVGLTGSYQNVADTGGISGATSSTLTLPAALNTEGDYVLVANNGFGSSVTSSVVRVLVIENNNTPQLVGEWLNGAQSLNDVSGAFPANVHAGIMAPSGATPSWVSAPAGFSGSAMSFNGSDAIIITNTSISDNDYRPDYDHNITNRFSIAFWAQGFPGSGLPFVSKDGAASTQGWQVNHDSNNSGVNQATLEIPGIISAQQENDGSGIAVTDNNWHHYCATYDSVSGQEHFYIDGVCVDYFDRDFPYVKVADAQHLVLGGGEQSSLGNFFTGSLFDVRLYNYAVQPADVQQMITPPPSSTIGLYLGSTNSLVMGTTVGFAVSIPEGFNANGPVTVTVTNNAPGVALVEGATGNPFTVTFAQGGANVQYFTLDAVGPGTISFTAGSPGLANGNLSDMVAVQVIKPALIGHWITGGQTLADQSGYQPAGTEDGLASSGTSIGSATAVYNSDVPAPYTNQTGLSCLSLNGTYAVAIEGTSLLGPGSYYPTFDEEINNGFSFTFWAKGWSVGSGSYGDPWFSKNGGNNNIPGYMIRPNNQVAGPDFLVRYASGAQNNSDNVDAYSSIITTNSPNFNAQTTWHHYACVWDGIAGTRKLYVDGILAYTIPNDYGPVAAPVDSMLVIGGEDASEVDSGSAPNIGSYFTGEMFDVRMYNYPLSFSEVQSIYQVSTTNVCVAADTQVIDLGQEGMASISLPLNANTNVANTIYVTNMNPSVVSITTNGVAVSSSVFSITFAPGAYLTERLDLTGLSNGVAAIAAGGPGFNPALATARVCAPQLVARWFIGSSNFWDSSGYMPSHTHDLVPVTGAKAGDTVIAASPSQFTTTEVPPGFPGAAVDMNASYTLVVSNSDAVPGVELANGNPFDSNYQPTFDDVIANQFTITFWENTVAAGSEGNWAAFVGKGGDDETGFQVRKNGNGTQPDGFAMYYSGSHVPNITSSPSGLFGHGWVHVAIVFDGYNGYRAVYTNGVIEMIQPADYGSWSQAKHHHMVIGSEEQPIDNGSAAEATQIPNSEDNSYLNAYLYDFRVYNYAMDQAQLLSLQTYSPPDLSAQLAAGSKQVQLSWSLLYPPPTYQLYTSPTLGPTAVWTPSPLTPTLQNGQYVVTDTVAPGQNAKFYMLKFVAQ